MTTHKTTHTPGPWKLVESAKGWFLKTRCGCVIGGINRFPVTAELASQCEANARLAEAAPELLEALDYLLEQTVDQDLKHGITLTEGEEDARKRALTVIARVAA